MYDQMPYDRRLCSMPQPGRDAALPKQRQKQLPEPGSTTVDHSRPACRFLVPPGGGQAALTAYLYQHRDRGGNEDSPARRLGRRQSIADPWLITGTGRFVGFTSLAIISIQ
jgi:hypothetical protein